jgi:hypothetical protein
LHLACEDQLPQVQDRLFVHVEVRIHRIDGDNRGQQGRVGGHQIAFVDEVAAGPPADRGGYSGEFQIECCPVYCPPCRLDRRTCLSSVGDRLIEVFLTGRAFREQPFIAGGVGLGTRKLRLPLGDLSLGLVQHRLEGPGIDLKEQVPFLDHPPVLEIDVDQVPADAGPDFDRFHGSSPRSVLVIISHLPLHGMADQHDWGRRGGQRRRLAFAACQRQAQEGKQDGKKQKVTMEFHVHNVLIKSDVAMSSNLTVFHVREKRDQSL